MAAIAGAMGVNSRATAISRPRKEAGHHGTERALVPLRRWPLGWAGVRTPGSKGWWCDEVWQPVIISGWVSRDPLPPSPRNRALRALDGGVLAQGRRLVGLLNLVQDGGGSALGDAGLAKHLA